MNTPTDRIVIKDLMLRCILGVNDEERRERQDVLINLVLWADLAAAAASDDLQHAVDYRALKKKIVTLVENSQCHLAEALADRIASLCLEHPLVQQVQVIVEKPAALRFARSVGVDIVRSRLRS